MTMQNSLCVLPAPSRWQVNGLAKLQPGDFSLYWNGPIDQRVTAYAQSLFGDSACGAVTLSVVEIDLAAPPVQADESHRISINESGISVSAQSTWGALRALATLHQLSVADELFIGLEIEDKPRFRWRGLLLDVARHFLSAADLHAVLDDLARLKMNVLHIHFSDDQAYRLPSLAWPLLPSAEHYSPSELRDLVGYASDLGIRIIPEIDVPGHVTHWLCAYPQWGMHTVEPTQRFGVHEACLNPADEQVYAALEKIFSELTEIFPDQFVHVGGDEVNPSWWDSNAQAQEFIAKHKLKDVRGLQNYFLQRLQRMLAKMGKRVIGWDEVLHADVPDCVIQNWRGMTTRDRALALNRDCVVSAPFYLDLFFPADIHYQFDIQGPQAQLVAMENQLGEDLRLQHIAQALVWTHQWRQGAVDLGEQGGGGEVLGGEACLWAELVDSQTLMSRLFSRLPVIAETFWSSVEYPVSKDQNADMYRRLNAIWRALKNNPERAQQRALGKMGFSVKQQFALTHLEPVKWYGRLLGEQALSARLSGSEMPQARPYGVNTPLNRAIDFLLPESMAARNLGQSLDADGVKALRAALATDKDDIAWPEETMTAVDDLAKACDEMLGFFDNQQSAQSCREKLLLLYQPKGEFMLAVIPHFIAFLEQHRD